MKKKSFKNHFSRGERKAMSKASKQLKKTRNNEVGYIIMLATIARTIKAKLGFDMNTADGKFLVKAQNIYDALTLNTGGYYTPAFADMGLLLTLIGNFGEAINNMGFVLGDEGAKAAAKKELKDILDDAVVYVNKKCRTNQTFAVEIITGAKMEVIRNGSFDKPELEVKQGNGTGEIKLRAKAVKIDGRYVTTTYYWQYSIDDGKTWEDLDDTQVANTVASGMLAGIPTVFRARHKSTKGGMSTWCAKVGITPR